MKNSSTQIMLLTVSVFLTGCLFLPVPHYRQHLVRIEGNVYEAETRHPIPHADVCLRAGRYVQQTTTDTSGHFSSNATYGWHLIYWIATPSSGSLLPTHIDWGDGWIYEITISADGYASKTIELGIVREDNAMTNNVYLIRRKSNKRETQKIETTKGVEER